MKFNEFFKKLNLFSLLLLFLLSGCNLLRAVPLLSYAGLLFFYLLTLFTFYITAYGLKRDNKTFIKTFYGSVALRFFLSIAFLVIYLIFSTNKDLFFVGSFALLYFLFTIFEIYSLMVNLRPDFKNKQQSDE